MTAPAHPTPGKSRTHASTDDQQTRLPWWALVLPALVFAILFVLLLGGGQADAAQETAGNPVLAFLVHVRDALLS